MATLSCGSQSAEVQDGLGGRELQDVLSTIGVKFGCREGECRTCEMRVVEGMENLTPPTEYDFGTEEGWRLMCQASVITGSVVIEAPQLAPDVRDLLLARLPPVEDSSRSAL